MIVGISIALHEAKRTGQNQDTYLDLLMLTMLTSVVGARIYYVIFHGIIIRIIWAKF